MGYELNVAGKSVKDCGAPCNSLFFDENERNTLRYWISSWAAITVVCCLFTVSLLTFYTHFFIIIYWVKLKNLIIQYFFIDFDVHN